MNDQVTGGGIKGFFLKNGEKLFLAAAVALMGMFAWSALGQAPITADQQPEALATQAEQALKKITLAGPEAAPDRKIPDVTDEIERGLTRVDPQIAQHNVVLDGLLFEPLKKRPDPRLLPVERLQVAADRGPIAMAPDPEELKAAEKAALAEKIAAAEEAALAAKKRARRPPRAGMPGSDPSIIEGAVPGSELTGGMVPGVRPIPSGTPVPGTQASSTDSEGRTWIVITGIIPIGRQADQYFREFQDTMGGPSPTSGRGDQQQGDMPNYYFFDVARAEVSPSGQEGQWVDLEVIKTWTDRKQWAQGNVEDIVYPEFIHPRLTWPLPPLLGKDWGDEVAHRLIPAVPLEMDASGNYIRNMQRETTGRGASGYNPSSSNPDDPLGRLELEALGDEVEEELVEEEEINELLFRYFDFTAQAGKSYRYRVKLRLYNPNYEVEPRFLAKPESSKEQLRDTEWSQPSAVVSVPPDHQIYTLAARPATRPTAETGGKIGVVSWYKRFVNSLTKFDGPAEAAKEFDMLLGDVANFAAKTEIIDYANKMIHQVDEFRFAPNMQLIDARGGVRGRDKAPEPSELLFLDLQGNLVVHRALEEAAKFKEIQESKEFVELAVPGSYSGSGGGFGGILGPPSGPSSGGPRPRRGR